MTKRAMQALLGGVVWTMLAGCQPTAQTFEGINEVNVGVDGPGTVVSTRNDAAVRDAYVPRIVDCPGTKCKVAYCTTHFADESFSCPDPAKEDGRYHVVLTANPSAGARFDGWEVARSPNDYDDPSFTIGDLTTPNLELSWDRGSGLVRRHYTVRARFSPIPAPPVKTAIADCTDPVTKLLVLGDPYGSELLAVCSKLVAVAKAGNGSRVIHSTPVSVVATDSKYAYFYEEGEVRRQLLSSGAPQKMIVPGGTPIWLGANSVGVFAVEKDPNGTTHLVRYMQPDILPNAVFGSIELYSELPIIAADVDDAFVYFVSRASDQSLTLAKLSIQATPNDIPIVLATAPADSIANELHHTATALYWGLTVLPKTGGAQSLAAPDPVVDSAILGTTIFATTGKCVRSVPVAGGALTDVNCKAPPTAIVSDGTKIFYTAANILQSTP